MVSAADKGPVRILRGWKGAGKPPRPAARGRMAAETGSLSPPCCEPVGPLQAAPSGPRQKMTSASPPRWWWYTGKPFQNSARERRRARCSSGVANGGHWSRVLGPSRQT